MSNSKNFEIKAEKSTPIASLLSRVARCFRRRTPATSDEGPMLSCPFCGKSAQWLGTNRQIDNNGVPLHKEKHFCGTCLSCMIVVYLGERPEVTRETPESTG